MSLGQYVKHKGLLRIGVLVLKEALKVVEASNIVMEELPGIPISFFKLIIKLPLPIAAFILKLAMSKKEDFEIITSTLQSLKKGKKTEIDYLNGEFVKLAKKNGVKAPYNSLVVDVIQEIERTGKFYSPEEVVTRFSEI
jgi:2-dehydropantoate 2-reductase